MKKYRFSYDTYKIEYDDRWQYEHYRERDPFPRNWQVPTGTRHVTLEAKTDSDAKEEAKSIWNRLRKQGGCENPRLVVNEIELDFSS